MIQFKYFRRCAHMLPVTEEKFVPDFCAPCLLKIVLNVVHVYVRGYCLNVLTEGANCKLPIAAFVSLDDVSTSFECYTLLYWLLYCIVHNLNCTRRASLLVTRAGNNRFELIR